MSLRFNDCQLKILKPFETSPDKLGQYATLDSSCMPFPWTGLQWQKLNENYSVIEIKNKDTLLGFALIHGVDGDDYWHLLKIVIAVEYRRCGMGKLLMQEIMRCAKTARVTLIGLEVESNNFSAIALYQLFQAKVIQHKKSFYSNGNDALVMQIELSVIG